MELMGYSEFIQYNLEGRPRRAALERRDRVTKSGRGTRVQAGIREHHHNSRGHEGGGGGGGHRQGGRARR